MMYVKIKKIYTYDKCECTQHAQTYYFNIRMCIFIHTCIQKDEEHKTKKTRNFTTTTKIYLNMMFVYYFHRLHHFQLLTRDL